MLESLLVLYLLGFAIVFVATSATLEGFEKEPLVNRVIASSGWPIVVFYIVRSLK